MPCPGPGPCAADTPGLRSVARDACVEALADQRDVRGQHPQALADGRLQGVVHRQVVFAFGTRTQGPRGWGMGCPGEEGRGPSRGTCGRGGGRWSCNAPPPVRCPVGARTAGGHPVPPLSTQRTAALLGTSAAPPTPTVTQQHGARTRVCTGAPRRHCHTLKPALFSWTGHCLVTPGYSRGRGSCSIGL